MSDATTLQKRACEIASKIIADYLEHYSFPWQGESHMHDCITEQVESLLSEMVPQINRRVSQVAYPGLDKRVSAIQSHSKTQSKRLEAQGAITLPDPADRSGPAETPRTDAVCPTLNLSHQDMRGAAWDLRNFARTLEREADALRTRIGQFDACVRAIATALGGACCGGVDGDPVDPLSTTSVLVSSIKALRTEVEWLTSQIRAQKATIVDFSADVDRLAAKCRDEWDARVVAEFAKQQADHERDAMLEELIELRRLINLADVGKENLLLRAQLAEAQQLRDIALEQNELLKLDVATAKASERERCVKYLRAVALTGPLDQEAVLTACANHLSALKEKT